MQCLKPLHLQPDAQDLTIPCGQCVQCRIRKREQWASRILLESFTSPTTWFVTLTYRNEELTFSCLPGEEPEPTLWKRERTLFLKRLRKRLPDWKIRYFCVGEYGSQTARPHWHLVLYGLPMDPTADVVASWGHGFVTCDELTLGRARYCARYTVKKITGPMSAGDGRCPEHATMSTRPGLGKDAALMIGRQLAQTGGSAPATPRWLNIGEKRIPIDRYTRTVIESVLGNEEIRREARQFKAHAKAPEERAKLAAALGANPDLNATETARVKKAEAQRDLNRLSSRNRHSAIKNYA